MKIIYVNARFLTQKITGVQRFAVEISKTLKLSNCEIVWIAPNAILPQNQQLANDLNVHCVGKSSGHYWEQVELVKYLKSVGSPQLINLCNTAPLLYKNQLVTIHDLAFLVYPQWFSLPFRLVYRFLIPQIAKRSKQIVTVSNFSKHEIIRLLKISEQKISVVYNGVTSLYSKELESFGTGKYVLFVGSLDPRKNLLTLIEAIKLIPEDIQLKVLGGMGKSFNQNILNIRGSLNDRIQFLGYVNDEDLAKYYKNALCFVYPSHYEGFGLPPLEAQTYGIPVIVSDIPVFHEVYGDSVMYINQLSHKSIAQGICRIYDMDSKELEELKFRSLENCQKYNWINSGLSFLKVITE